MAAGSPGTFGEQKYNIWSGRERKLWTIILFIGLLLKFMSISAGPVTLVALAKEFNWDKENQGSILSSYFWGSTLSQLIGGWLSDIYGGDNVLYLTSTCWVTIVFLTPVLIRSSHQIYLSSTSVYLLIRFAMGLSHGAVPGAMASLLARRLETNLKSSTNGMINSGACLGSVIIGVVGSLLLDYVNWSSVFYCIGSMGIIWLLMWRVYVLKEKHLDDTSCKLESSADKTKLVSVPWMTIFVHPPLWAMVIANIAVGICFNVLFSWLPIYFHDTFPQSKGWIFNAVPWLVNSSCAFISGIWADNLFHRGFSITCVRKFFNVLCQLGPAVSLILLSQVQTFPPALLLMTVAVGMTGFHNAGGMVTPQDMAPEYAGSVAGVTNTVAGFAVFGAVYFTGHFLREFQSWPLYFNIVAGVSVFGCLVFSLFGSARRIT